MVELAGQEARLADLLSKRKRGGRENEGGDGEEDEDENWGYWVKQEVGEKNFFFSRFLGFGFCGVEWDGTNYLCRRGRWKRLERCLDR